MVDIIWCYSQGIALDLLILYIKILWIFWSMDLKVGTSARVHPIFYYPLSIGTRGEGYRGHGTSQSVVGMTHPNPRHGTPPIRGPKVKSRNRHWMQVKALESSSRSWNGTPLTLSGTFINAHTQVYPHARVHRLQYHTHLLA